MTYLEVPYICDEVYDFSGPWAEYPAHKAINISHLRLQTLSYYEPDQLASMFQGWLFFGLVRAILKPDLVSNELLRVNTSGQKLLTMVKLPHILQEWEAAIEVASSEEKTSLYDRHLLVLSEAAQYTWSLTNFPHGVPGETVDPILSRQCASFLALFGSWLERSIRRVLSPGMKETPLVWSQGSLLHEEMEMQGWCPFLIAGVASSLTLESTYLATLLGPPKVRRNHRSCSDDRCVAKSLAMQHTKQGCKCGQVTPDMRAVVEIIEDDITPLLCFIPDNPSGDESGTLEVLRQTDAPPYVALSHVWSDGLGNECSNSLMNCQLSRIQRAVNSLFDTGSEQAFPFWMDTLLVPQGYDYRPAKDKSLPRMTQIYKDADKVLVIDSQIVASCSMDSSAADVLLCVNLSQWIRRLWTLQEGAFASSIHFLVSDGTRSLSYLLQQKLPLMLGEDFRAIFGRSVGQPFYIFNDKNLGQRPSERQIIYMLQEVQGRVSTFRGDEALCIALLLDIDPKDIVANRDTRNPLPILLQALNHSIPPCILFVGGERLEEVGFRWAPRSFLVDANRNRRALGSHPFYVPAEWPNQELMLRPSGVLDEHGRGLKVTFPGIRLGKMTTNKALSVNQFVIDTSLQTSIGGRSSVEGQPASFWRITYVKDTADEPWEKLSPRKETSQDMAVIIGAYGPKWRDTAEGILVLLQEGEREDEVLFVRRVCLVLVSGTPEWDDFSWMTRPEQRITGTWLPVTQMWCVD